jgi:hypothetical protein
MAPGSHLALSHGTTDGPDPEARAQVVRIFEQATTPAVHRSREQISVFFDGFDLVEPGLVRLWQWRPDGNEERTAMAYAGVGRTTAQLI